MYIYDSDPSNTKDSETAKKELPADGLEKFAIFLHQGIIYLFIYLY